MFVGLTGLSEFSDLEQELLFLGWGCLLPNHPNEPAVSPITWVTGFSFPSLYGADDKGDTSSATEKPNSPFSHRTLYYGPQKYKTGRIPFCGS